MSNALLGYGLILEMALPSAPTVWTTIQECFSAAPPNDLDAQVDVTHYTSPQARREFIAGLTDGGEVTFEMNFIPGSITDQYLVAAKSLSRIIRITYYNGVIVSFTGLRRGYQITTPVDDKMTAAVTFKVSGAVTQTSAIAPTVIAGQTPSISGTLSVGSVLTVKTDGVFNGATSFAYQWRRGVANTVIAGATNATYTTVTADNVVNVGLNCLVTPSNGFGAGTAVSTPNTSTIL